MVENRTWFSLLFSGRLGHPDLPHFWTTPFSRCSGCPSPDSKPSPSRTNCRDVSQRWFRKTHAEKWEPAAPETSYRYYGTTRWLKVESNFMTNAFSRSWWTQKKTNPSTRVLTWCLLSEDMRIYQKQGIGASDSETPLQSRSRSRWNSC